MQDKQKKSSVATFIRKLIQMMETEELGSIIRWDRAGTSICVLSVPRLESLVLPTFFRHSKFASFVRQLNMYGFSKCKTDRGVTAAFSHPHFTRLQIDCSQIIKRGTKSNLQHEKTHQLAVSHAQQQHGVGQQKITEVDVATVGSNTLQYASTQVCLNNNSLSQPEINELLGDLEEFLENRSDDDLLWSSQIVQVLNEPRYRRIKGNILGLWEIDSPKGHSTTQTHLRMEFIL